MDKKYSARLLIGIVTAGLFVSFIAGFFVKGFFIGNFNVLLLYPLIFGIANLIALFNLKK
jgi:hypothetical protein